MVMTMIKRVMCILLALTLAVILPVSVLAAEEIQTDKPISMTIHYLDQGTPLVGAEFRIYLIADMDANGQLTAAAPFDQYAVDLEGNTEDDWLALGATLKGYILRDRIPATDQGVTDDRGQLEFPNQVEALEQGLYLVMGMRHVQGKYEYETEPFMVILPTWDESTDDWAYDVAVKPKFIRSDAEGDTDDETVKRNVLKIWECSCGEPCYPDEIEVQLLRDGEVYDTVILSEENNWQFSWDELDADYDWQVVENVPEGYTVIITRTGITFLVVNTCTPDSPPPSEPSEPSGPSEPSEPSEPSGPTEPSEPPDLPQTGQLWWPVPVLFCAGLVLILFGLIRRREEEYGA